MTREERLILDSLDDIERIMVRYTVSIDYSKYIEELKGHIEGISLLIDGSENEEDKNRLLELKKRAEGYLETTTAYQRVYVNSLESEEMGK